MSAHRLVPRHQLIDGVPRSPFLEPTLARAAVKFRPRDGDIVLTSYAKSGTHWTQQIIQLIVNHGDSARSYVEFMKRTPMVENHGLKWIEDAPSPRTMRTHFQVFHENFNEKAKYVYVARNPWDCCLSFFHHVRGVEEFEFEAGTLDDFLESFLSGDFGYGDYFDHVSGGYSHRHLPNVFFVTYEELKADTRGVVLRLAHFIGEEYGTLLETNNDIFDMVMKKSSFEYMARTLKAAPEVLSAVFKNFRGGPETDYGDNEANEEGGSDKFSLFRKGSVNNGKEAFTQEQHHRIKVRLGRSFKDSDIVSLWSA